MHPRQPGALILVVALGVTGCTAQTPPPTPTPISRAAPTPLPSVPAPTLAPTPTPVPTRAPVPTATPAPVLPLRISALLDPPTPRAGTEFVLGLTITNDGNRPAHGVYIATSGPWERWTILDLTPPDVSFARDAAGWRILSGNEIAAHGTATIAVHIRADSPSEDQLTFAVREAEPGEIR